MPDPPDKDHDSNLYNIGQGKRLQPGSSEAVSALRQRSKEFFYFNTLQTMIHQATMSAKKFRELLLIADAALQATGDCLNRMKELAEQAAELKASDSQRPEFQREINLLRAKVDRLAYNTNESVRQRLGLPPIKGHFAAIDDRDLAAVAAEYQLDQFDRARFVYDDASDKDFDDYIGNLPEQEYDQTLDEIIKALISMRPGLLGVDDLNVTAE